MIIYLANLSLRLITISAGQIFIIIKRPKKNIISRPTFR
jgi:hypothetical protein